MAVTEKNIVCPYSRRCTETLGRTIIENPIVKSNGEYMCKAANARNYRFCYVTDILNLAVEQLSLLERIAEGLEQLAKALEAKK